MKPHFGHLYSRPNLRHLPSRLIWISPQLGQRNFVDSVPGGMGLPQLVQVNMVSVLVLSVIIYISVEVPKLLGFLISAVLVADNILSISSMGHIAHSDQNTAAIFRNDKDDFYESFVNL